MLATAVQLKRSAVYEDQKTAMEDRWNLHENI